MNVKDYPRTKEEEERKNSDHCSLFASSANLYCNSQYNLFAAISNKRSAFKELEHESHIKQPKLYPQFENVCQSVSDRRLDFNTVLDRRKVSEKGVQCQVEKDSYVVSSKDMSSSDQLGSFSSINELKLTQSERLHKPNFILVPGRASDPCIYSRTASDVHKDTTISDRLSVDQLNLSVNLSSLPRHMPEEIDIHNLQLIPGLSHSTSKSEIIHLDSSSEQKEKFSAIDGKFNSLDATGNTELLRDSSHVLHFDRSPFVPNTASKTRCGFLNKVNFTHLLCYWIYN